MEKAEEVAKIVDYLNSLDSPGKGSWTSATGNHGVVAIEIKDGRILSLGDSATPIKMFLNTATGELRMYWAYKFNDEFKKIPQGRVSSDDQISSTKKMGSDLPDA